MIPGPNWGRRYGSHHRRLCARPGCGAVAAATLRFLPTQREAWLVELDHTSPRTEGDLCARHAAALVLPRGWQLHDERIEGPEAAAAVAERVKPRRTPRARRTSLRAVVEPQPQLDLEPVAEVVVTETVVTETVVIEPEPEPEPEPADAAEPEPMTESTEVPQIADLEDVFDVRTPLLRRAFENVMPLDDENK